MCTKCLHVRAECFLLLLLPDVIFSVQLSSQTTFNNNQKVIFDNVISNVGNGYNDVTGIFTVPHNGSYELTLRNMGNSGGTYTDIVRDNTLECTAHGAGTNQQGNVVVSPGSSVG